MNLSKKSRYGITALIDLAVYAKDQCVQLSSIAERNNISVKYLEQIFSSLRKSGLVRSVKGPQGGYLLAKRPESGTDEKGISTAIQKLLIDQMNDQTDRLLKQLTLRNLVDSSMEYSQVGHEMYYI